MPEAKAEAKPEPKPESKPKPEAKSKTSGILEFIQTFPWTLTLLLLVFLFWSPLHKLVGVLPDALANSETVTVGSLSLRVGKRLSEGANQEVRDALSGMTATDMTVVLENPLEGSSVSYGGISSDLLDHWVKLEQLGMVTRESDEELSQQAKLNKGPKAMFGVKATAKYHKVRKFLLDVLTDVIAGGVRDSQPDRSRS